MDKVKLMKLYVDPIGEIILRKFSFEETKNFETRVNDFYQQNSSLEPEKFKQQLIREFGLEVESARYYSNNEKTDRILKNVLFFFWITILGLIIGLLTGISFAF